MPKPFLIPVKMKSKHFGMILNYLKNAHHEDDPPFKTHMGKIWQKERADAGDAFKEINPEGEYKAYVTKEFIVFLYKLLAGMPQGHTSWLNPDLKIKLMEQLSDVDAIVPVLMSYNEAGVEEVQLVLMELQASMEEIEKQLAEEQKKMWEAGFDDGLKMAIPNPDWPIN